MTPICNCGAPAERAEQYCQSCWEGYCASQFWNLIRKLATEEAGNA